MIKETSNRKVRNALRLIDTSFPDKAISPFADICGQLTRYRDFRRFGQKMDS